MKVIVATRETQGWRDNDFCWALEDELVLFPPIMCDCGSVDDECGCRRAMAGMSSHRATTTVKIADHKELDADGYLILITNALQSQGYVTDELLAEPEVVCWIKDCRDVLISVAAAFPVGTVLERREQLMRARTQPHDRT